MMSIMGVKEDIYPYIYSYVQKAAYDAHLFAKKSGIVSYGKLLSHQRQKEIKEMKESENQEDKNYASME